MPPDAPNTPAHHPHPNRSPFFYARQSPEKHQFGVFFLALGFGPIKVQISLSLPHCPISSVLPFPTNTSTPSLLLLPYPTCLNFIVFTSFLSFLVFFFRVQVKKNLVPVGPLVCLDIEQVPLEPPNIPALPIHPNLSYFFHTTQPRKQDHFGLFFGSSREKE